MAIAIAAGHWSKSSRRGGRIAWASMVGIVTTANLAKYRVSGRYRGDELFASQSRSRLRRRRGRKAGCSRECTGPADAARSANNGYSVGGAVRVGRVLEELGYWWFEEPVQHYHVKAMGEVSRRLDITVSAGEQTYTLSGLADLIEAGVRMVQPDVVKWAALPACGVVPLWRRHTASKVPHQTQPTIGHTANLHLVASLLHMTKPCEWNDTTPCQHSVFENPPKPADGLFHLPTGPGLGLQINEAELAKRRVPIA